MSGIQAKSRRTLRRFGLFAIALAICAGEVDAQVPPVPPAPVSPAAPALPGLAACPNPPGLTLIPPRDPLAPEQIQSFIDSLSQNDARLEILVGQGRLLALERDLAVAGQTSPLIAVGDETIIDFELVGPRHLRLVGRRIGITDLSIVTGDNQNYNFEVSVVADLDMLRAQLRQSFPDAQVRLAHLREHVIVEGQARDTRQVAQIIATIEAYLDSVQTSRSTSGQGAATGPGTLPPMAPAPPVRAPADEGPYPEAPLTPPTEVLPEEGARSARATIPPTRIINLIQVPGPQQVLLKVQVAELNRTALRQLGASFLLQDETRAIGSTIGGPLPPPTGAGGGAGAASLLGLLNPVAGGAASTVFGVFDRGDASFFLTALRRNQVLKILAEPNLVALHGQEANFLSGGEFPVPVPQPGAGTSLITIQYQNFGVGLTFVPYILDRETIRLSVAPEVSSIDFSTGVVIQGTAVPGIATRRTSTVVEIKEGQTLAISGILQVELEGSTERIPGLGDLPYVGAAFRSNTTQTVERELVIMVTPYLVEPLRPEQAMPLPGADVLEPDDLEFYLKGRIEKRNAVPYRATAAWDDPLDVEHRRRLESHYMCGPYGYTP